MFLPTSPTCIKASAKSDERHQTQKQLDSIDTTKMKLAQLVTFAAGLEMQTPDGNHVPVRGRKFDDFNF